MTPPVFFAVAALGLMAPLTAQTPVHSMPGESGRPFVCLTIFELAGPSVDPGVTTLEAEEATRPDWNVEMFSDLNPLAPNEQFHPVRIEAIEGLEASAPDLEESADPVPVSPPSPVSGGVVTVGRRGPGLPPAAPVPEPTSGLLAAIAVTGLIGRRRRA